jgi:hypothetical protein
MEEMMKQLIAAVCFMLAATPFALAQDKAKDAKAPVVEKSAKTDAPKKEPSEKQKAQQERMKDCSGKAGDRKGDDRKKFMSSCLKGEDMDKKGATSEKQSAQQSKMKSCNKDAGDKKMKGDERKAFMKDCLSK